MLWKEIVTLTHCHEIPLEKIEKYIEAFHIFSKNEKISANGITKILKNNGYYISIEEVEEMIKEEYDLNEACEIDIEGFIDIMDKYEQNNKKVNEENYARFNAVLYNFNIFDKDKEGKIIN